MGIITLPNFRTTADVTAMVRLKDGGLAIDWSGLTGIKAWLYSDAQKAISGRFDVSVNQEDHTLLKCDYSATKPQYLGVNRIIIQAKYNGRTKTYDKAIFNFVPRTSDVPGDITIDEPIVDVELEVEDVSSSILDTTLAAMLKALDEVQDIIDIHRGPQGPQGETGPTGPQGPVGPTGATPAFKVGTVTTGEPGTPVVITITGTAEAPVLNIQIPQGMQGNTGSSVDYPFELVNNLTTNDATKGLSAQQGVVLDGKISQLRQDLIGYINYEASLISTSIDGSTNKWVNPGTPTTVISKLVPISPNRKYTITAKDGFAIYAVLRSDAHTDGTSADYATGFNQRYTLPFGESIDIIMPQDARYLYFRADNLADAPYEPLIVGEHVVINTTDVIDNLLSTSTEHPLSANQGRILKESIGETGYEDEVDLDEEITLDDFWVGRSAYPSSWYGLTGYQTKIIDVPDGAKKVTIITQPTGAETPSVPVFVMASYTQPTADRDPVDFADGYTSRLLLTTPSTTTINLPENCTYIAVGYYDMVAELYYNFQVSFTIGSTVAESLAEIEDDISVLRMTGGEVSYFDNFQISPMLTNDKSRPLVYEGDTKSSENFLCNAVTYPDGTIIASRSGVGVVKIDDNGETTILSLPGSTDMRCLWMDEDLTVYASPFNAADADGAATNIGNGLYRLPYGTNLFTKVLNLSAGNTIWTMCRDRSGYIYCGEYSIANNVPVIYRSSDNGLTWSSIINFNSSGLTSNGRHIHSVIYNKYNDKLYAIVGEINTIFSSGDNGENWTDLNVQFYDKGSSMFATPYGIIVGSDSAYWCDIDILLPDDASHKKVSRIWADTVFGIRQSDQTGFLYAFCKIDSSVKSSDYMPQIDLSDDAAVAAYIASHTSGAWRNYYDSMKDYYPGDAMRPTHFAILISRNYGKTWEVLYAGETGAVNADGIWTIGHFRNGECLCGHVRSTSSSSRDFVNPIIISEGKHKYTNGKISVEGDIFAKTLSSVMVTPL